MALTNSIKRLLIGPPFPISAESHERLDKIRGLAVFASDPISSNAYATEAIMSILILLGSGALSMTMPIALGIFGLVAIVIFSYTQTIMHYPEGGGAYFVSKDNLGTIPSLVAAAAILTDYILTVSVSSSAGVRAVTSAFPELFPYRVWMALAAIALITWINLRGVRESGTIFALPTYAFVAGVLLVIGIGMVRYLGLFGLAPLETHPEFIPPADSHLTQFGYIWLVLRAFAAGCTALTGIEAISDGVKAFKPPEALNAVKTMVAMGVMAMVLFLGISFLSTYLRIVPEEEVSTLSQMTALITGRGSFMFYWVQFATMAILFLAANTGYQDFPRLSAFLARDGFLPRWLRNRGDRLVYSSGIVMLTILASILVLLFRADEIAMLPLYALGVMVSFTLSQAGMFVLFTRISKLKPGEAEHTGTTTIHYESGWWWKRIVSGVGAVVTFVVLVVLVATKFVEGAWVIVLALPLIVILFRAVKQHYLHVSEELRTRHLQASDLQEVADVVIMPIGDVHRGVLRALKFACAQSNDVRVVAVVQDQASADRIQERWDRFPDVTNGAKLEFIHYEYRDFIEPLIEYIERVNNEEFPDKLTQVVIPEFVPRNFWEQLLHNQTASYIRQQLRHYPDIIITHVPHQL